MACITWLMEAIVFTLVVWQENAKNAVVSLHLDSVQILYPISGHRPQHPE
jgi:hypothetical protein